MAESADAAIVRRYGDAQPQIDPSAWIAPGAAVVGDVVLGADTSVWYGSVVRGDVERVRIGRATNVQDGAVIHVTRDRFPALVGDEVTIGHRAVVHGCVVEDGALVGIGSIVLDGARIGEGALVGAGAVVTPGTKVEAGTLVLGAPARAFRKLSGDELLEQRQRTLTYVDAARMHAASGSCQPVSGDPK